MGEETVNKLKAGVLRLQDAFTSWDRPVQSSKRELSSSIVCRKNEVENELHFIFDCAALKGMRAHLIDRKKNEMIAYDSMSEEEALKLLLPEKGLQNGWLLCTIGGERYYTNNTIGLCTMQANQVFSIQ